MSARYEERIRHRQFPPPPHPALLSAYWLIERHATGGGCEVCQDGWCVGAEWALTQAVMDNLVPPGDDGRDQVTKVARMVVHWHRQDDTGHCRPCGLVRCARNILATEWLSRVSIRRGVRSRFAGWKRR